MSRPDVPEEPRWDLETRCGGCRAWRYHDNSRKFRYLPKWGAWWCGLCPLQYVLIRLIGGFE